MNHEHFSSEWPAHPDSVPAARHAVLTFLRDVDTADPPLNDVGLAVSEAVTNAVNHAYVDREMGDVRVAVTLGHDEVELTVEDDGRGMLPRPDSPGLGLGLPLIATVADRFDTVSGPGGGTRICAWFRRHPAAATLPA
jgi:serine/threonine-protein kinase RsbW/stage II sporulation protein AB (anti-sigma F factor)